MNHSEKTVDSAAPAEGELVELATSDLDRTIDVNVLGLKLEMATLFS